MCFPSVEKKHLRHLLLSLYNKTSPSVETLKNLVWLISPGMVKFYCIKTIANASNVSSPLKESTLQ